MTWSQNVSKTGLGMPSIDVSVAPQRDVRDDEIFLFFESESTILSHYANHSVPSATPPQGP